MLYLLLTVEASRLAAVCGEVIFSRHAIEEVYILRVYELYALSTMITAVRRPGDFSSNVAPRLC